MSAINVNRLNASSIPHTFKQLCKMMNNKKISFKNIVQRSYVWEQKRRSEFIWSVIMNYPIPPIYAGRDIVDKNNNVLDIMDGQQRLTTIYKFLNDEFKLTDLSPIACTDENGKEIEFDISGKKFSELDEEFQDLVRDRTVTIYYYDNITQAQKTEMFKRLNSGKPLTTKNKALASCQNIEDLLDIGSHPLFDEMLTVKARDNKNQAIIVMKSWVMLNKKIEDISFESKVFNPLLETIEITPNEKDIIEQVYDVILETHEELKARKENKIAKKLYTETHFVSLVPFFKMAIDNSFSSDMMADWIERFFKTDGDKLKESYDIACNTSSAKNVNVKARDNALMEDFYRYFSSMAVENKEDIAETTDTSDGVSEDEVDTVDESDVIDDASKENQEDEDKDEQDYNIDFDLDIGTHDTENDESNDDEEGFMDLEIDVDFPVTFC